MISVQHRAILADPPRLLGSRAVVIRHEETPTEDDLVVTTGLRLPVLAATALVGACMWAGIFALVGLI